MFKHYRQGMFTFISFMILDILCLFLAYIAAIWVYSLGSAANYRSDDHFPVVIIMMVVDVAVTLSCNTLRRVLRRRKRKEAAEGAKHVGISFVVLAVILFTLKWSASYSRLVIYLTYVLYYALFVVTHSLWRRLLGRLRKKRDRKTAILMTTDRFVEEGLEELNRRNIEVRAVFLLKNIKVDKIGDIHVVKDAQEAAKIMCWDWIDQAYVYGLDHQMIPEELNKACAEMRMPLRTVDFEYRVIELKTIPNKDPQYGALSFLEGKRDIPFPIRRVYWITETEADLHRGFHAHKLNCQLLFCPHGKIDIVLDDGETKEVVTLEGPSKGLLLMPGMWREMIWRETGSVLCVLASEYYDPEEYIRNYDEFMKYKKKK